jgi:hypothetical protein
VIGAYGSNGAFVFVKDTAAAGGRGAWSLQEKLIPPSDTEGGSFGWSVAVDGDRIIVGTWVANDNIGNAHVFERSSSSWSHTQTLMPSDSATDARFGWHVDLEGDAIVVGGRLDATSIKVPYISFG